MKRELNTKPITWNYIRDRLWSLKFSESQLRRNELPNTELAWEIIQFTTRIVVGPGCRATDLRLRSQFALDIAELRLKRRFEVSRRRMERMEGTP